MGRAMLPLEVLWETLFLVFSSLRWLQAFLGLWLAACSNLSFIFTLPSPLSLRLEFPLSLIVCLDSHMMLGLGEQLLPVAVGVCLKQALVLDSNIIHLLICSIL